MTGFGTPMTLFSCQRTRPERQARLPLGAKLHQQLFVLCYTAISLVNYNLRFVFNDLGDS